MNLNDDFSKRAAVHAAQLPWTPSPMPGVSRRMLDRIGDEVARATSVVRYDPGSHFSAHVHGGGEEFLVLEGVFQDEHGDYPVGTYVRNPPHSSHTPGSEPGCVILVKLWQFDPDDRTPVRLNSNHAPAVSPPPAAGVHSVVLHRDAHEAVFVERWASNAARHLTSDGGLEIFVLDGSFVDDGERFSRYSWLRLPDGTALDATAGTDGARVWLKSGHLRSGVRSLQPTT